MNKSVVLRYLKKRAGYVIFSKYNKDCFSEQIKYLQTVEIKNNRIINKKRNTLRSLAENALLLKLFVIFKKICSEYQIYTCAYFFEKP